MTTTNPFTTDDPRVERARRLGQRSGRQMAVNSEQYALHYLDWLRRGDAMPAQWREAFLAADQLGRELRDLAAGSSAAGGYTVPPGFLDRMFVGLKRGSAMVRASTVHTTEGGQSATLPLLDDTGVNGSIISEAGLHTVDTATPFASRTLAAFLYSSRIVKVSRQLAQDGAFPLERWLPRVLGARIGRAFNAHATTGTGGGTQPAGLVPATTVGAQAAAGNTTTATYDALVDTIGAVDAEYLEPLEEPADVPGAGPGFIGWMTSSAGLRMLRKVKDTAGAPVVTTDQDGRVRALGWPVMVNNDVPTPAASAKSALFGNFAAGGLVRQVLGDVFVLRFDELYVAAGTQIGWVGFGRLDFSQADAAAVRAFQNSAT